VKSFSGTIIRNNAFKQNENDKINDKKEPCSDHIQHTLEQANQTLTYKDLGTVFSYGTLRNEMSKHATNRKILKLRSIRPIESSASAAGSACVTLWNTLAARSFWREKAESASTQRFSRVVHSAPEAEGVGTYA